LPLPCLVLFHFLEALLIPNTFGRYLHLLFIFFSPLSVAAVYPCSSCVIGSVDESPLFF
jgi:hypothetical protein